MTTFSQYSISDSLGESKIPVKGVKTCKITDWLQSDQNKFENVLRLPEWHLKTTPEWHLKTTNSQGKEATTLRKVGFNGHFIKEH